MSITDGTQRVRALALHGRWTARSRGAAERPASARLTVLTDTGEPHRGNEMPPTLRPLAIALLAALSLAAAPALAKDGSVHAIVDENTGILLGGSRDGEWLPAAAVAPALKGGERYSLYGLNGAVGEADGGAPEHYGAPCPETAYVEMSPLEWKNEGDLPVYMIAVTGGWNAVPRKPKRFLTNQKVYHEAAAAFLRDRGVAKPDVRLTQVIRIDLEGDGVDEVLVAGTRRRTADPGGVEPGDYSFVFLRKLVAGKVATVALLADIHPDPRPQAVSYRFDVMAVMDLNGDGAMEIVIRSEYYEGSAAAVFTVAGLAVTQVLIEGCGA